MFEADLDTMTAAELRVVREYLGLGRAGGEGDGPRPRGIGDRPSTRQGSTRPAGESRVITQVTDDIRGQAGTKWRRGSTGFYTDDV